MPALAWEGIGAQLTLPQSASHGSVHSHLAGDVRASVRASGVEKEGSCATSCDTAPMLVGCDRSFRNWSVHQDRNLRGVGLRELALASKSQ